VIATRTLAPPYAAATGLTRPPLEGRWTLLQCCVVVYLLAAVGRVHQLLPGVGLLRPILLSAGLALACIALAPGTTARLWAALKRPIVLALLGLLAWSVLSVPMALHPRGALDTVVGLGKAVAMLVVMATATRSVHDVRRLALTLFAAMVVFAVIVLQRYDTSQRLGGLVYYDANEFALLVVVTLPFGVYGLWRERGRLARVALTAGIIVGFIVFVACGSRGGMLAMGAALCYALLRFQTMPLNWRVTAIVVAVTAFGVMASEQFWNRLDSVVETEDDYNITSPTGRLQVWKRGVGYMIDRPILGVGAGNFPTAEGTLSRYAASLRERNMGAKWSAAHNSFVQVGAELGVPGLVFFLLAIGRACASLWRAQRASRAAPSEDRDLAALASATMSGLVGFLVGGSFLSLAYSDMLFALLALATAISVVARARQRERLAHHPNGVPA